ncbi:MAG: TlpA disulfide reductase family protein [Pseudomonadota bacterium]
MDYLLEAAVYVFRLGNWVLIPVFVILFVADWLIPERASKHVSWRWMGRPATMVATVALGFVLVAGNFPMKPMFESLAVVQATKGKELQDFAFVDARDSTVRRLSDHDGKVVLINFWGTYCAPCIEEFPDLRRLETTYEGEVIVIALSDEPREKIARFLKRVNSPSLVGRYESDQWVDLETFRPLTVVLDRDRTVRSFMFGKRDFREFDAAVSEFL